MIRNSVVHFTLSLAATSLPLLALSACSSATETTADPPGTTGGVGQGLGGSAPGTGGSGASGSPASGGSTGGVGTTSGGNTTGGAATSSGGTSSGGSVGTGGTTTGGSTAGTSTGGSAGAGGMRTGGSGGTSAGGSAGGGGMKTGGNTGSGGTGTGGAGGMKAGGGGGGMSAGGSGGTGTTCQVGSVPAAVRQAWDLDPFYQKYADANGIPILSSNAPPDNTLTLACQLVIEMVGKRDDVRLALIRNRVHFGMIGINENTNDIPEYAYMPDSINTRARGLGGNPGTCAEESILCGPTDRWRGESICVHEFAHTISVYGLYDADPTFRNRLEAAYQSARSAGRFANTYAMENAQEYWAEGVQNWYYTNLESATPNGVHGPIDKREELLAYDKVLYDLIGELLPLDVKWADCYRDG